MKRKLNMSVKTLIALALGVGAGLLLQDHKEAAAAYIGPFGTLFLNCIKMIVVPMVFSSIIVGICGIGDAKRVGRIGGKTVLYFLCTTAFAATLGLLAANLFQIGKGFQIASDIGEVTIPENPGIINTLLNIIPSNPIQALANGDMLQIIAFAIILGLSLIHI